MHTRLCRATFVVLHIVILYLALTPIETLPEVSAWDKTNHVLAFATLAIIGTLAFPRHLVRLHFGLAGFGGLIETLQSYTPHRSAEWSDLVADVIGLVAGGLIMRAARSRWARS